MSQAGVAALGAGRGQRAEGILPRDCVPAAQGPFSPPPTTAPGRQKPSKWPDWGRGNTLSLGQALHPWGADSSKAHTSAPRPSWDIPPSPPRQSSAAAKHTASAHFRMTKKFTSGNPMGLHTAEGQAGGDGASSHFCVDRSVCGSHLLGRAWRQTESQGLARKEKGFSGNPGLGVPAQPHRVSAGTWQHGGRMMFWLGLLSFKNNSENTIISAKRKTNRTKEMGPCESSAHGSGTPWLWSSS